MTAGPSDSLPPANSVQLSPSPPARASGAKTNLSSREVSRQ